MKKIIYLLLLLICFTPVFAESEALIPQDSITYMVIGILLGLYELVSRVVPTVKDWSVLNFIVRVLNLLVPNKAIFESPSPNDPVKTKGVFSILKKRKTE